MAGVRDTGALASGGRDGAGVDGVGIRGSGPIPSCLLMESSTAHSAGDSTLRDLYIGRRSTAVVPTTRLMRQTSAPGDLDRTTQPAAPTPMASTREPERSVALSTPGQQWLVEALVGAGSTVAALQVAGSTAEAADSVVVVTDAETA
jgi:hypothetical protein